MVRCAWAPVVATDKPAATTAAPAINTVNRLRAEPINDPVIGSAKRSLDAGVIMGLPFKQTAAVQRLRRWMTGVAFW